jgi:hypothetical protein
VHEDALPRLKAAVLEQSLPRSQARDRQARAPKAAGVERAEIRDIAEAVADEVAHAKIVERPVTVDEIKGLLDAAYE